MKSEMEAAATTTKPPPRRELTREEILIPLLAQRSMHLPGNSWREDWVEYLRNNHIVFGTCLHDRLHPIETWERLVVLAGSVSFSLAATNVEYLWDWHEGDGEFDPGEVVYSYSWSAGDDDDLGEGTTLYITSGMIILWTFGSAFHSIFDMLVWNVSACACCHPGGCCGDHKYAARVKDFGSYILIPTILGLAGLAVYASHLRLTTENEALQEYEDDLVDVVTGGRLGEYGFLLRFGVELALAWFVFSPLLFTILFSGKLGCGGRLPLLGGRPRAIKMVEKRLAGGGAERSRNEESHSYARF